MNQDNSVNVRPGTRQFPKTRSEDWQWNFFGITESPTSRRGDGEGEGDNWDFTNLTWETSSNPLNRNKAWWPFLTGTVADCWNEIRIGLYFELVIKYTPLISTWSLCRALIVGLVDFGQKVTSLRSLSESCSSMLQIYLLTINRVQCNARASAPSIRAF